MTNDNFYFFQVEPDSSFRDYGLINNSLRKQGALFRYGSAFDNEGKPLWEQDFDSNPLGIYRRKEDFRDPLEARITLAEAYQLEREARSNHPIFSPREPRLPGE